jgi:hypothetical protein
MGKVSNQEGGQEGREARKRIVDGRPCHVGSVCIFEDYKQEAC